MSPPCPPALSQCLTLALLLSLFSLGTRGDDTSAIQNTTAITDNKSITICSEPLQLNSGFNASFGLATKIIKGAITHASEVMGYQARFIEQPWRRCILMVQNNTVDAVMASVWKQERSRWMQFPLNKAGQPDLKRPAWVSHYSVFVAQDTQLTWDGQQFGGIKHGVGGPLGYVLAEQLEALGVLNKHVNSAEAGFQLIARGRLDGFVIDRSVGYSHIEAMQLHEKVVPLPVLFSKKNLYIPLSKAFYLTNPQRGERFFDLVADYYSQTLQ